MNLVGQIFSFASWWYSGGIKKLLEFLSALLVRILNFFAIKKIFRTLFSPWKRVLGQPRKGLAGLGDRILDNVISRGVGFGVRLLLIFIFVITLILYFLFAIILLAVWTLYPVVAVYLIWLLASGGA